MAYVLQSAETFFATLEEEEAACLVLDVQLNGVSEIDVKRIGGSTMTEK